MLFIKIINNVSIATEIFVSQFILILEETMMKYNFMFCFLSAELVIVRQPKKV